MLLETQKRQIENLILILLCIAPFSGFLLRNLDMWYAQGYFLQIGILLLYCLNLSYKNKPLACLLLWSGLLTAFYWISFHITTKQNPFGLFFPFFNFLCIIIFYELITRYASLDLFQRFLKYFKVCVWLILGYCLLQKFGLDQFYKSTDITLKGDEVVGIIGNPMHISQYLGICLPVFLTRETLINKLGILLTLVVISLISSFSGLMVALGVLIFYSCFYRIFKLKETILLILLGLIFVVLKVHSLGDIHSFVTSSGRLEHWKKLYPAFVQRPITGWGLGFMNALAQKSEFFTWRHAHLELYHFAVEIGVIGAGLGLWGIVDYFMKFKKDISELSVVMASMFVGFLIASCFGYPCHIWIMAILGISAYSYQYLEVK